MFYLLSFVLGCILCDLLADGSASNGVMLQERLQSFKKCVILQNFLFFVHNFVDGVIGSVWDILYVNKRYLKHRVKQQAKWIPNLQKNNVTTPSL